MQITFDPAKNERNIADRNLSFALVEQFDWVTALIEEDTRKPHVISLRKANSREVKRYEKTAKP